MKFKYIGEDNCFCLELIAYKIMNRGEYLKKGMVIYVPNDNKVVVNALKANGTFVEIKEKKPSKKDNEKNNQEK